MSVFGFQAPEEMMLFLHRQMMAAQVAEDRDPVEAPFGSYWLRVVDFFPETVVVFGYVHTLEELRKRMEDMGMPASEVEVEIQMAIHSHRSGFRFGTHYSEIDPEGTSGDTPVDQILMTITEDDFNAAREAGWQLMPLILEGREFASQVMSMAGLEPDTDALPEEP